MMPVVENSKSTPPVFQLNTAVPGTSTVLPPMAALASPTVWASSSSSVTSYVIESTPKVGSVAPSALNVPFRFMSPAHALLEAGTKNAVKSATDRKRFTRWSPNNRQRRLNQTYHKVRTRSIKHSDLFCLADSDVEYFQPRTDGKTGANRLAAGGPGYRCTPDCMISRSIAPSRGEP